MHGCLHLSHRDGSLSGGSCCCSLACRRWLLGQWHVSHHCQVIMCMAPGLQEEQLVALAERWLASIPASSEPPPRPPGSLTRLNYKFPSKVVVETVRCCLCCKGLRPHTQRLLDHLLSKRQAAPCSPAGPMAVHAGICIDLVCWRGVGTYLLLCRAHHPASLHDASNSCSSAQMQMSLQLDCRCHVLPLGHRPVHPQPETNMYRPPA